VGDVPQLGEPEGPTAGQLERGYHGNGNWPATPEAMAELTKRSAEVGRSRRQRRIAKHDEQLEAVIEDAATLQANLIREANRLIELAQSGQRLSVGEMDIVKRGQAAAEKVTDRVIGKVAQKVEHSGEVNLISWFTGRSNPDDETPVYDAEDAEWSEDEEE
jgi:hypothetical protein